MNQVPAWADTRHHRLIRRLKALTVVVFFAVMFIGPNLYVHQVAKQKGEIQGPTLMDLALFRRIVRVQDAGAQKVTLFGTQPHVYRR